MQKIEWKTNKTGPGTILIAIGVVALIWLPFYFGIPLFAILLFVGIGKNKIPICPECGNRLSSGFVKLCPTCKTRLD